MGLLRHALVLKAALPNPRSLEGEKTIDTLTLKCNLVRWLNLRNRAPREIGDDEPLFEQGLGLDSLDMAVLVGYLEKEYGIKINRTAEGRNVFASVRTLAEFIALATNESR